MDNPERVTYLAATDGHGDNIPFGIKKKDRNKHMYVLGRTGMGKSTLLQNMAVQDIRNGEGIVFIDPHGATAQKLLEYVPEHRVRDVVYLAPFDTENPIAFNVLEDVSYEKRHIIVQGLLALFKTMWKREWNARIEYVLSNMLLVLLEYPTGTLLSVLQLCTDESFQKKVTVGVRDPVVRAFWEKEFIENHALYATEVFPFLLAKFSQIASTPFLRNMIGQPTSSFNIRTMIDERRILIVNLSKGQIGEPNMMLLGGMITTRVFLSALERAEVSERERERLPDVYVYLDEFQNFANDSFADILSEARKYKLNLILAHQYIEQMDTKVQNAVFGNVGTIISFRIGPHDAEKLETVFAPELSKGDLLNLGVAKIYLTLLIDGVGSRPFSAKTIPMIEPPLKPIASQVIENSQKVFGRKRNDVEKMLHEQTKVPVGMTQVQRPVASHSPDGKPVSDLRSALRAVTEKITDEVEGKKEDSLKDVLSKVTSVTEKKVEEPILSQNPPDKAPYEDNIFEIAEKELRAVFKGDF